MTLPQPQVLEFPAMLHGLTGDVIRKVRAKGQGWAREYLKTGAFRSTRQMRQVSAGELLEVRSGILFDSSPHPRWRVHLLSNVFESMNKGLPPDVIQRMDEAFESFCLNTSWGAFFNAVSPYPPRSAERMARRLSALLHFWEELQVPRYAYWHDRKYTLEELIEDIYGKTLEAWCLRGSNPVREHLTRTVEHMSRATREECMEAVLRVIPSVLQANSDLQNREALSSPAFLRERLAALAPKDFEDISSADRYTVNSRLYAWDRQLGRQ